jgi:hypothetical protein
LRADISRMLLASLSTAVRPLRQGRPGIGAIATSNRLAVWLQSRAKQARARATFNAIDATGTAWAP